METDTIIYFHPTQGQMHKNTAAKKHWWQDAALREEKLGLEPGSVQSVYALGEAKHIFSHVEWRMVGYHIEIDGELPETWICADIRDLEEKYPIPSAFLAYKKALL